MIPRGRRGAALQMIPDPGTLLWSDDFTGTAGAAASSAAWTNNVGRWGASSGENQYYTDGTANAALDGASNLVITVKKEVPPDSAASPNNFTSARLVTDGKKTFTPPCRIAVRAKVPSTKGLLPAIWTMGQDAAHPDEWPRNGEIDIMEIPIFTTLGADANRLEMNLHGPATGSPTTHINTSAAWMSGTSLTTDYHVWGIDWYANRIVWHVDGVVRATMTQADFEAAGGAWTPFSGSLTHYLILNLAVGNDWTGDPDGTSTWPQSMLVDWVKVWSI